MSIRASSPIKKQAPKAINFFILSIAFQVWEALCLHSICGQPSSNLYLLLNALIYKLSLLANIIQVNFEIRASLKFFDFLNPSPPHLLGRHKCSQNFQSSKPKICHDLFWDSIRTFGLMHLIYHTLCLGHRM